MTKCEELKDIMERDEKLEENLYDQIQAEKNENKKK